jgi:hypothetical protein
MKINEFLDMIEHEKAVAAAERSALRQGIIARLRKWGFTEEDDWHVGLTETGEIMLGHENHGELLEIEIFDNGVVDNELVVRFWPPSAYSYRADGGWMPVRSPLELFRVFYLEWEWKKQVEGKK